jgi:RNA polymerase sigma factor (sigma-70 family)
MDIKTGYSDSALVKALHTDKDADDAIRYLYRIQFTVTAAYIKQNSGNEQDAEDIFQEVICIFIELVKKEKFRGESSVSTFLYALTRNIWLNELKKRGRVKLRHEKFEKGKEKYEADINQHIIEREMKIKLMEVVDAMGEICKKILLAFYFDNLPMKEIVQVTAFENEQVVRNKKYKCLKQLEQMISDQPELAKNLKSMLVYG